MSGRRSSSVSAAPSRSSCRDNPTMAQLLRDERELRRVIGDGEDLPDREVEGLGERDLIELYRGMVLLRTYDERSLVYHRQGRIGTYAIFWNHEQCRRARRTRSSATT